MVGAHRVASEGSTFLHAVLGSQAQVPLKLHSIQLLEIPLICTIRIIKNMKFKTNLKCSGCVATVKAVLDETIGEDRWAVDLDSPNKTLTVNSVQVTGSEIQAKLIALGYSAESLEEA